MLMINSVAGFFCLILCDDHDTRLCVRARARLHIRLYRNLVLCMCIIQLCYKNRLQINNLLCLDPGSKQQRQKVNSCSNNFHYICFFCYCCCQCIALD